VFDGGDGIAAERQAHSRERHSQNSLVLALALLLEDRGWTSFHVIARREGGAPYAGSSGHDVPNIWAMTSVEEIENTARAVVGPDEPFERRSRSQEDMEADSWTFLAKVLRQPMPGDHVTCIA
jgi:hypothetical protein